MAAEKFFNKPRGKVALRMLDYERYTLTPIKARKKLAKKVVKPSTNAVEFEQWQLDMAERIFGKGE